MIIDAHAHYEPRLLSVEDIIINMRKNNLTKTVLIPLLTDPPETKKSDKIMAVQRLMFYNSYLRPLAIAITKTMYRKSGEWNLWLSKNSKNTKKYKIVMMPDNQTISELTINHPDNFQGWIFINPSNMNALDELEKYSKYCGMIGVKIHPFWHSFPLKIADDIVKLTEELGMPLLIHLGFCSISDCKRLVNRFKNLKIIFAHLGVPFYKDLWPLVKQYRNAYMDISSTYHVNEWLVRKAIKAVGPHKCIFGTDSPYAHSSSISMIMQWIDVLPLNESEKDLIYYKNFLEVTSDKKSFSM